MKMTQLSVSSVILAAVLSGCSQQNVIGGSQVVNGSSQMSGRSQIAGGSQSQIESGSQMGSQQQVEAAAPVVAPTVVKRPAVKPAPKRVYSKPVTKRVAAKQRVTRTVRRGNGLPAAKPGQCFAKVKTPAKYITKSKRVLIQKASAKRVLVRAPQYRWIAKKVLVRKAQYVNRTIPAVYRNQTTRVMVKPAYNTWRKGHGKVTRIDNMTGQVMCRVTIPAVYKNVTRRVIVRPAQNVRKFIPAVYKTVKQKKRVSGAVYRTVQRPARYKTQNYRVKVAGARYVWKPVHCSKKHKQHRNYRKASMMHKPVKRVYKQQYRRPAAQSGVSYAEYLAVMNAPLKKKAMKKRPVAKKKVVQKPVVTKMPKKAEPAKATTTAKAADASKTENKTASKSEIQQNIVYGIQAALKSKGYNPGKLDGKMGPKTAAALKSFQSSRGLPVGVLSKDTFRALGLVK